MPFRAKFFKISKINVQPGEISVFRRNPRAAAVF